jgi:Peptidase M60, enhancin and enhancin-like/N-terminal domain of M60-like peptidases
MKATLFSLMLAWWLAAPLAHAQSNPRTLQLDLQADVHAESAERLRFPLSEFQSTGIYVKEGDVLVIQVADFSPQNQLAAHIGFRPLWGDRNKSQETKLASGKNTLKAQESGLLYFIYSNPQSLQNNSQTLQVTVTGGSDSPLFVLGKGDFPKWHAEVRRRKDIQYVELLSERVIITLPVKDYLKNPIRDPQKSFDVIHRVLAIQDQLAGFDDSSPLHTLSRHRYHFLVDEMNQEGDGFYMYATHFHVGLIPEAVADLTDPDRLKKQWGIWHEIGHTHQQTPWTWSDIEEVSVNIMSLKVQEDFGWPSRLNDTEYAENGRRNTLSTYALAKQYLSRKNRNFSDLKDPFIKLVMFDQLRQAYGWGFFTRLFKAFRERYPTAESREAADNMTDAEKVSAFIFMSSQTAQTNLLPFFQRWGLQADRITQQRIQDSPWPLANTAIADWTGPSTSDRVKPPQASSFSK